MGNILRDRPGWFGSDEALDGARVWRQCDFVCVEDEGTRLSNRVTEPRPVRRDLCIGFSKEQERMASQVSEPTTRVKRRKWTTRVVFLKIHLWLGLAAAVFLVILG